MLKVLTILREASGLLYRQHCRLAKAKIARSDFMRFIVPLLVMTFYFLPAFAADDAGEGFKLRSRYTEASDSSCRFDSAISVNFAEEVTDTVNDHEQTVALKGKPYTAHGIYTYILVEHERVLGVSLRKTTDFRAVLVTDEFGLERRLATAFLDLASQIKIKLTACR